MVQRIHLADASAVIDALGGNIAAGRRFGVSPKTVSAWRRQGLPTKEVVRMRAALDAEGERSGVVFVAPLSLWGAVEP